MKLDKELVSKRSRRLGYFLFHLNLKASHEEREEFFKDWSFTVNFQRRLADETLRELHACTWNDGMHEKYDMFHFTGPEAFVHYSMPQAVTDFRNWVLHRR